MADLILTCTCGERLILDGDQVEAGLAEPECKGLRADCVRPVCGYGFLYLLEACGWRVERLSEPDAHTRPMHLRPGGKRHECA